MLYNIVTIYEFTWFWVLWCNKVLDVVGWLDGRVQSSNGSNGWRNFSSASLCELCDSAGTYLTIESLLGRCTPPQTSLLPGGARRCREEPFPYRRWSLQSGCSLCGGRVEGCQGPLRDFESLQQSEVVKALLCLLHHGLCALCVQCSMLNPQRCI